MAKAARKKTAKKRGTVPKAGAKPGKKAGSRQAQPGSPRTAPRTPALDPDEAALETLALTTFEGVGPARVERLGRLGLRSALDLLTLVPRGLERGLEPIAMAGAAQLLGCRVRVRGKVAAKRFFRRGRRSTLRVKVTDDSGAVEALFFNQPWMRESFHEGEEVELEGRVVEGKNGPALAVPRVGRPGAPLPQPGSLRPLYPHGEGIGKEFLRGLVGRGIERFGARLTEAVDPERLEEAGLVTLPVAVRELHQPPNEERFHAARRRLALEPLLELQARLAARRGPGRRGRAPALALAESDHRALLAAFPFEATACQARVMGELREDLAREQPMRRLLQGDVGSGKTVVGLYAALAAARSGHQAAFLAPTELLAEQHWIALQPALRELGLEAVLLTGSLEGSERQRVLGALASGRASLAFGTHALFQKEVHYHSLAVAVIDEQHRFGVAQRRRLLEKGRGVHALLMTATPIPRTLALTLYGDLEVSVLRQPPPGRGSLQTSILHPRKLEGLVGFLDERLGEGERAFWIAPRIETSPHGRGVEELTAWLHRGPLAKHGVELVHGRLETEERQARLERFRSGQSRLLAATTVIEVGVDVPEATALVIEGAERFGLSQLHQLRGRVGRGERDSWCFLFGRASAAERLEALVETRDGFAIAEADLRQRGMGDLTGVRQAGFYDEGFDEEGFELELLLLARELLASDEALAALYLERAERRAALDA